MHNDAFRAAVEAAREYEKGIAEYLMRRGARVLPVYDFSGLSENKAPKLQAAVASKSLVLPDLLVCKDGASRFVEVKQKATSTLHRKTQVWETGISLRLWGHYKQVKVATGLDVWLFFIHVAQDEVLYQEIGKLVPRIYNGPKMGWSGMAFFPCSALIQLGKLSEIMPQRAA
jgi:hypothetical protein